MEGDHASQKPGVLTSFRSNIPRAISNKGRAPVSATIQAARSLKRRSIGQLSSGVPAKRTGTAVPDCSRYPVRRSSSVKRENMETVELKSKIVDLESELVKVKAELEIAQNHLLLKDQNLAVVQSSLEIFKQTIALKDGQMGAIQAALDAEKGNCAVIQALQQKTENIRLENELSERLENIGQLLSELTAKRDELRKKDEEIRILHNTVVDLKGQIRVAIRVRPPLGKELEMPTNHLSYPCVSSIKLDLGKGSQVFEFQRVFGPNVSQERVFNDVKELVVSCLHGYNVSIIAYGQTGSGKTHTMRGGGGESEGLIPRAVKFLFQSKDKLSDLDWTFEFKASFVEVYNEEVYDLLAERNKLELKMGAGITAVNGLKYYDINDNSDVENILLIADRTRSTAATKCNEQSSRSHAVFKLSVEGNNKTSRATRHASLHLVDLAGSERVKESGAEGDRFKEMTFINSALSNLQNCIRSQLNKNQHIPYRNSKLTMLLRDSLGAGNSKTMVIVALNPALAQIAETKRSLEFAQQMSLTKIGSAKKQEQ
ncbi:hypothetical protein Angca_010130 [Angiostrongylus cantonensis]|nr:hypothetical protein Angca_010130 [Angiostrongylus cantonensis]